METILVLFGGRSTEHEISCISARTVISALDTSKYRVIPVGITKDGRWLYVDDTAAIADMSWVNSKVSAILSPDAGARALYLSQEGRIVDEIRIDLAFPVLHGLNGEDGTVQGLFELTQIPYVGPGVLACAVSMDKLYTKVIVNELGIRQADYVGVRRSELSDIERVMDRVEEKLSYPIFVKPSAAGSSRGVTKAHSREELLTALYEAARHDSKILIEETIVGREIECAVFSSGDELIVSGVGEIVAAAEFYDYDAKYNSEDSETDTHPVLPEGVEDEIRKDAAAVFRAVDAYGLSRVDFFFDGKEVIFNEINSIPGFTPISMYPMLFGAVGIGIEELVEKLAESAKKRPHRTEEGIL